MFCIRVLSLKVVCVVSAIALLTSAGQAQEAKQASKIDAETFIGRINSGDEKERAAAVHDMRDLLRTDPAIASGMLHRSLLKPLLAAGLNDDAADLALQGALASADSTITVEALMTFRVKALLAAGKGHEALADAKSLYNVSTMAGTGNAILLISEALRLAYPNEPERGRKYRAEQVLGLTVAPGTSPQPSSVFKAINVNPGQFEKALPVSTPEQYGALVARGNLLLMADRVDEAADAFEAAYTLADNRILPAATENIARCIKARDGTIGQANQFVLSLRPPSTQPAKK